MLFSPILAKLNLSKYLHSRECSEFPTVKIEGFLLSSHRVIVLVPDLLSYRDAVRYSALQALEVQGHRQEHLTQTLFECL